MAIHGERLRHVREATGMSQTALAEAVQISLRQINRYEVANENLTAETLIRIARILNVSTDYLLGLSDTPHPVLQETTISDDELAVLNAFRREGWLGVAQFGLSRHAEELKKSERKGNQ